MAYGDPHCLTIELQLSYRNVKSSIITDYVILLELFSFCQFYMDKQSDLHCACRTIQFLFLAFCKVVASPPSPRSPSEAVSYASAQLCKRHSNSLIVTLWLYLHNIAHITIHRIIFYNLLPCGRSFTSITDTDSSTLVELCAFLLN